MRIASLAILCLALAAVPLLAQQNEYFDNGPANGTTDAWTINFGYIVSNSYVETASSTVTGFNIYTWEFPGDVVTSLDWSVTSAENGGTVYGSGTASGKNITDSFISTNQYGYDIDKVSVTGLNVFQQNAGTYWLNLQNASVASGDPVYWDENSGAGCGGLNGTKQGCPSSASESAVGTIPSEAFTIYFNEPGTTTTPEPSSVMLFGSGILGLAGLLRRKLF